MRTSLFFIIFLGCCTILFAAEPVDTSIFSNEDIYRIERIVEALNPEHAIQTALASFPYNTYPLQNYLETQLMRLNRIFNEYGFEFSQYATYNDSNTRAHTVLVRLKSRYTYLHNLSFNSREDLYTALILLKD